MTTLTSLEILTAKLDRLIAIQKPRVGRKAPRKTHTQSVLFRKAQWTESRARSWLKSHNYITRGLDVTTNMLRFRQYDPEPTVFRYRNQSAGKGITLVLGFVR